MNILIWLGILFCISQSALFSGLNLAFFSVTRLRLEVEASHNNPGAIKVLNMRQDSNFLLTTILWGNVGVNVFLALLSNSVMTGIYAFVFSTFVITILGEIIPQAYFSRHALKMASWFSPLLKMYQFILYPVAKPTALLLDMWLGSETIYYFKEKSLKRLILKHVEETADIDHVEGIGAVNFLSIDDLLIGEEGVPIHEDSIITLPFENNLPVFPKIRKTHKNKFLIQLNRSSRKWIIIQDEEMNPRFVLDADGFIRSALLDLEEFDPHKYIHEPIVVTDSESTLGAVISEFQNESPHYDDDLIKKDVILHWGANKRIITGADIFGRLMRGISKDLINNFS